VLLLNGGMKSSAAKVAVEGIEWLGAFSDIGLEKPSLIDSFADLISEKLKYGPHERDIVLMQHVVGYESPSGDHGVVKSILCEYGSAVAGSAMSRTVGWTAAIGAQLLLEGIIKSGLGVVTPTVRNIYEPFLIRLEAAGISFLESE